MTCSTLGLLVGLKVEFGLEVEFGLAVPVKQILVDGWAYLDYWNSLLFDYSTKSLDVVFIPDCKY